MSSTSGSSSRKVDDSCSEGEYWKPEEKREDRKVVDAYTLVVKATRDRDVRTLSKLLELFDDDLLSRLAIRSALNVVKLDASILPAMEILNEDSVAERLREQEIVIVERK